MPKPQPEYDIKDFLRACKANGRQPSNVVLMGGVLETAASHFSLKTKEALLAFINTGGLEDLEFVNSIEYRRSFEVPPPICDAYHFKSGFSVGYISFFFSESNRKWIIKSFHRDDACGPTIMEFALRKAGLLPACLEGSE